MEILQKNENRIAYDPAVPLMDINLKKSKTLFQKDICAPMFIAALYSSQDMEATQVPINGMLLGHKRNEITPFATTLTDLEGVMLTK